MEKICIDNQKHQGRENLEKIRTPRLGNKKTKRKISEDQNAPQTRLTIEKITNTNHQNHYQEERERRKEAKNTSHRELVSPHTNKGSGND